MEEDIENYKILFPYIKCGSTYTKNNKNQKQIFYPKIDSKIEQISIIKNNIIICNI